MYLNENQSLLLLSLDCDSPMGLHLLENHLFATTWNDGKSIATTCNDGKSSVLQISRSSFHLTYVPKQFYQKYTVRIIPPKRIGPQVV